MVNLTHTTDVAYCEKILVIIGGSDAQEIKTHRPFKSFKMSAEIPQDPVTTRLRRCFFTYSLQIKEGVFCVDVCMTNLTWNFYRLIFRHVVFWKVVKQIMIHIFTPSCLLGERSAYQFIEAGISCLLCSICLIRLYKALCHP